MTESSRRTDDPLERAMALSSGALARSPAGLLTDFDGTLSPIVTDPAAARLVDGAQHSLARLADALAVVAVVTGRAPLDARRMTGVSSILVAGNHGMEWLEPGEERPAPSPDATAVRQRLARVLARVPERAGVTIEDKGLSVTVHYRNAPDSDAARKELIERIGAVGPGLEMRPGRMSLELRPVGLGDKGAATRSIIDRYGLRGVVVMGDDVTDLDMFAVVAELRDARRLRGAIIGVGGADGEVPPLVAAAADLLLPGPEAAGALLAFLSEQARRGPPSGGATTR